MAGPTCSRFPVSAPQATKRRNTASPARTGPGSYPRASRSSNRRRAWSGFSAEPTARGRRMITRRCMPFRTNTPSFRWSGLWQAMYTPPEGKVDPTIDMKTPVRDQVNKMDAGAYFKLLAALMKDNPPAEADAPMVEKMAKIGIEPGKDFDISKLDPAVAKGLQGGPPRWAWRRSRPTSNRRALDVKRLASLAEDRRVRHGVPSTGVRHGDRPRRQPSAGCWRTRPRKPTRPASRTTAPNKYVMHLDKGQTPAR